MIDELAKAYEMIAKLTAELNHLAPVVHLAATTAVGMVDDLDDCVDKQQPPALRLVEHMLRRQQRLRDHARAALLATGRIA